MRLLFVVLTFLGGSGVLIYIASLIIIPNNPDQTIPETRQNVIRDKPLFWGSLLIVIGLFLLFRQFGLFYSFHFWQIPWQSVWAVVLIIIGAVLLFNKTRSEKTESEEKDSDRKLYRSRSQKMVGGVCGGLSEYFDIDVSVIRVLWVIGTLLSIGLGILAYIIMLIIFPEHPEELDDKKVTS
ncbi:MAG: PspC domain-containing protein [Calditrichia bacterium]|nr:PspC domain-containing protein [Calditrichia bacterium]